MKLNGMLAGWVAVGCHCAWVGVGVIQRPAPKAILLAFVVTEILAAVAYFVWVVFQEPPHARQ